jgi:hypothetical protein
MKNITVKSLCMAIGLALAGSASAAKVDFSGSNIYMKFLNGNQNSASTSSIDTNSGADQGQFTELNLVFKATLSPQVEAGGRIQSRSSASYWTDYGGFGNEGNVNNNINDMKFMKLRGAYVDLTPGYGWLNLAHIGSSDWGMFDPFTVGKVRYIDRDNYNGLYFKGAVTATSWEFAHISLPNYLQFNYGQGPTCCSTDSTQYSEAVNIAQFKMPIGRAQIAASFQSFIDHTLAPTSTPFDGVNTKGIYKNNVSALKASGSPTDAIDLRGAYYRSISNPSENSVGENWGNTPRGGIAGNAFKLDADWATPVSGLAFNFQLFNIGAGYFSATAARRESDVLLTEGSESAWYKWGNPLWSGGAAADYTQGAASPNGRPGVPNGTQNGLTDNSFMDFDESPAESAVGWKGLTGLVKYDLAGSPMSVELSRVGYNNNWQNYSTTGPLFNVFPVNQNRSTSIFAFKLNHLFSVMGGLDTNIKFKRVDDKDKVSDATAADDRSVLDNGITLSAGNQLHSHLYGTASYGRYIRDIKVGSAPYDNSKSIYGVRFAYNLPGFEFGMLTQWIRGSGNPTETAGGQVKIQQYRLKAYAQVNF